MAERSSELENNKISISANDSETAGLEVGAPTTYAATALGNDSSDDSSEALTTIHTTAGGTEIDPKADPQELKSQIEQTRNDMSETINAIQEKLSISNLVESAKDEVSEQISGVYQSAKSALFGTAAVKMGSFMAKVKNNVDRYSEDYGPAVSDASRTVVRTAKNNPIPLALIGLGIGLMLFNSRKKTYKAQPYRYTDEYDDESDYDYADTELQNFAPSNRRSTVKKVYSKVGDVAGQASETVSNAAGSAYSGVANAAGSAYSGVASAANTAYSGVGSVAEKAYEQVGNLGTGAKQAASWTQETYSNQLEENPLAVGAVALVLGAVVGLSLPSTEIEGQYLGETRNHLVGQAQQAAGNLISQAQQVVGDVTKSVTDEVKAQGSAA